MKTIRNSQTERVNRLQKEVASSEKAHAKIISGIVFGILLANTYNEKTQISPQSLFRELSSISSDHYETVINILINLIRQCYDLFKESTVKQILWLCE